MVITWLKKGSPGKQRTCSYVFLPTGQAQTTIARMSRRPSKHPIIRLPSPDEQGHESPLADLVTSLPRQGQNSPSGIDSDAPIRGYTMFVEPGGLPGWAVHEHSSG